MVVDSVECCVDVNVVRAVVVTPLVTVLVTVTVFVTIGVLVEVTKAVPITVELAVVVATIVEVAETGVASSLQAELSTTELNVASADGVLNVEVATCRFSIAGGCPAVKP